MREYLARDRAMITEVEVMFVRLVRKAHFTLLVAMFALNACRGPQTERGSMVDVDMTNWEVIAFMQLHNSGAAGPGTSRTVEVPITGAGEYRRFRLVAHDWAVYVGKLAITLDGDETWGRCP